MRTGLSAALAVIAMGAALDPLGAALPPEIRERLNTFDEPRRRPRKKRGQYSGVSKRAQSRRKKAQSAGK